MERYSVLMSLYEKEQPEYLRAALDSVINQTVRADEIVLVEDGPLTKDLYKIVNEYKENYPDLFHIVINRDNLGLGLSLNKGLLACRNELIARMDTDDIAVPDRCEKQLKYFSSHPSVSVLGGQIAEFVISPKETTGRRIVPEKNDALKDYMKRRCPFNHVTVMLKKTDVVTVGNYQDWFLNEDYYLWIRMALEKFEFANLKDTLVYVRVGEEMYQRRGGNNYYRSEIEIQKLLLHKKIIGYSTYWMNCGKRLLVEKLFPNRLRGWVFKKFARKRV